MKIQELLIIGFGLLIIAGLSLSFNYFQNVTTLNSANENLDEIISSSDIDVIHINLVELEHNLDLMMMNLPENKNPVWLFPTETTNFLRMQNDVDLLITRVDNISTIPKDSSAYHTWMIEINNLSMILKDNLLDARGFISASPANISFTLLWLIGVLGVTKMWLKNEN